MKTGAVRRAKASKLCSMRFRLLCLLCLGLIPSLAVGGEKKWHWVKAANSTTGWTVQQGDADVLIDGTKFTAQLFVGSEQEPTILLRGSIQNGTVLAKEAVQGSDYSGSTYHGLLKTKRWPEFSGTVGADSITLSDGWGLIGITRTIEK